MFGPSRNTLTHSSSINFVTQRTSLVEQLRYMYDKEFNEGVTTERGQSLDDRKVLDVVSETTLTSDGHLEVPVPWKVSTHELPNNYTMAANRLLYLKRRFLRDPDLFREYVGNIQHHLDSGHFEASWTPATADTPCWYLPHHPVLNPSKPGKVRIVFDCAARFKGMSLNDRLHQGPDLTANLVGVLSRFRWGAVAVSADIEEMFMQVRIPEPDRNAFRFLWWPNHDLDRQPSEFRMACHPFGATSSPFCATYALRHTAKLFGSKYKQSTRDSVENDFYVDDCLKALDTVSDAIVYVQEVCDMLAQAGFRLRKWMSNSREVLKTVPPAERSANVVKVDMDKLPSQKSLGLEWNAETDDFRISLNLSNREYTRRGLLSCIATLFDPLGFVAPWLIPGKILLQSLCKDSRGWDEPVTNSERRRWEDWTTSLRRLGEIRIPRCVLPLKGSIMEKTELHFFCDASETAYGVVAYACFVTSAGVRHCSMLLGKARVAPSKAVSIPRLELAAAVLATKMLNNLKGYIKVTVQHIYLWTDSMIVLYYIHNKSKRFATFVANRVAIIHEVTNPSQWRHVDSELNPADLASRGTLADKDIPTWLEGPAFLKQSQSFWPLKPVALSEPPGVEMKSSPKNVNMVSVNWLMTNLVTKISCWTKLLRCVAWLRRYKSWLMMRCKPRKEMVTITGPLRVLELEQARDDIVRQIQREAFGKEFKALKEIENVAPSRERRGTLRLSPIRRLCPVLVNDVIRVGGRLTYTSYDTNTRHPMILPKKHHVVDLIIRHSHEQEGHCGPSHTLQEIRKQYWIIQGGSAVKREIG